MKTTAKMKTLVKYFAGWLTSKNMRDEPTWFAHWINKVEKEEESGNVVLVFSLPKNANLEELEQYLQSKYG